MTTNDNDINANPAPTAAPPSAATSHGQQRRHATSVVIGAGLAGLLVGAVSTIAAIAFAWIVGAGPGGHPPPPRPMVAPAMHHGPPPPPMHGPPPGGPHGFVPPPPAVGGSGPGQPPAPPAPPQSSPAPHA